MISFPLKHIKYRQLQHLLILSDKTKVQVREIHDKEVRPLHQLLHSECFKVVEVEEDILDQEINFIHIQSF